MLVVECVPDVREIVTAALEQYGASVMAVDSPVTALGLVKTERPDVLVSSLSMPEKDGCWLIRQVRSLSPDRGGNTPAVAFTGCTTPEDRLNACELDSRLTFPSPRISRSWPVRWRY